MSPPRGRETCRPNDNGNAKIAQLLKLRRVLHQRWRADLLERPGNRRRRWLWIRWFSAKIAHASRRPGEKVKYAEIQRGIRRDANLRTANNSRNFVNLGAVAVWHWISITRSIRQESEGCLLLILRKLARFAWLCYQSADEEEIVIHFKMRSASVCFRKSSSFTSVSTSIWVNFKIFIFSNYENEYYLIYSEDLLISWLKNFS